MAARFLVLLKAETLLATDLMTARRPFFNVTDVVLEPGLLAAGERVEVETACKYTRVRTNGASLKVTLWVFGRGLH